MTILSLIEVLILVCLGLYLVRTLVTDVVTQRIVIGLVVLVFVLWLFEGAAVFGANFHRSLFR